MNSMDSIKKIDVPSEHWDRLFAPSSCLVMITTVDKEGRINAASYGTCVRVCHDPVYIAFTTGATKDTYNNVLANEEFVVNVPSFRAGDSREGEGGWTWNSRRESMSLRKPGSHRFRRRSSNLRA